MSLNIYDLNLREVIVDIIDSVNSGTVYVCRNVEEPTESDFEVPVSTPTLISSFPYISLKEKNLFQLQEIQMPIISGKISLKAATTDESRLAQNGDYVFIHVADGYYVLKGSILEIKAAKISTIMEFVIDTASDVPFTPQAVNLNLSEDIG